MNATLKIDNDRSHIQVDVISLEIVWLGTGFAFQLESNKSIPGKWSARLL